MASSISWAHAKAIAPFSWIILMQGWLEKSRNFHYRFDGSESYRWFGKDQRNYTSTTSCGRAKSGNRNTAEKLRSQCDHQRSWSCDRDAKIRMTTTGIRRVLIFPANNCWRVAQETFESTPCAGLIMFRRERSSGNS